MSAMNRAVALWFLSLAVCWIAGRVDSWVLVGIPICWWLVYRLVGEKWILFALTNLAVIAILPDFFVGSPDVSPFGDDAAGRDLYGLLLAGHQNTILVAVFASLLANIIAWPVGVLLELGPKWLQRLLGFLMSTLLAFPVMLLVLLGLSVLDGDSSRFIYWVGLLLWAEPARMVQAHVGSLRQAAFVQAARLRGASNWQIWQREMFPNLKATLLANVLIVFVSAILLESVLGYLGLRHSGMGRILEYGIRMLDRNPPILIVCLAILFTWVLGLRSIIRLWKVDQRLDVVIN